MNYYEKYIKYKNKYLYLKNNYLFQNAGANGRINAINALSIRIPNRIISIPSPSYSPTAPLAAPIAPSPSYSPTAPIAAPIAPSPSYSPTPPVSSSPPYFPDIYKLVWDCDNCKYKEILGKNCYACYKVHDKEVMYNKLFKPTGIQFNWRCSCGKENECYKSCFNCGNLYIKQQCYNSYVF